MCKCFKFIHIKVDIGKMTLTLFLCPGPSHPKWGAAE